RWRRSILVFVVLHRHRVYAAEPAIEINVSAAPAAERAEFFCGRLAANRADWSAGELVLGHGIDMGARASGSKLQHFAARVTPADSLEGEVPHTAVSQPKRMG